ncbi:MAG: transcriptional repressor [Pirellulaceae bacterium]|nr:transcriptional repressor [Planctomycetales bacterium]
MPPSEPDATWAKQALRDAALRATAARVAVLKLLGSMGIPMSHAEVVEALTEFGFDQSTLFRCLNEIADAGLVSRLDLGDQTRRFELRKMGEKVEFTHPHFMCVDCGELTCMEDFSVQISPSRGPRRDKLGTITEIMIRGHCGNCFPRGR